MVNSSIQADFPVDFLQDIVIIRVPARLSILEAVAFKHICQDLTQEEIRPREIIIDFQNTIFIDSSGLGALVSNFKITQEKGIAFSLNNVNSKVMAILNLTELDRVFDIKTAVNIKTTPHHQLLEEQLPTTHPSIRSWMKRLIDIFGSVVGLVITSILFIPIALAITIDNPGPVFFHQTRYGWMGKRFRIWKFRSMYLGAEAKKSQVNNQVQGAFFKNDNDPRITKVGHFIRRTSLDELPQFWNVLKGDMSLVGTRPPTPDEVEKYEVPEWQRFDVKPGMTGEWQVSGRSTVRSFEDVIRLDLQYQKNWSLLHDLHLILKTVIILFNKNSGAM
ncbi:Undecaprenyl-phosphate galactosephosphotransferase [Richelia intracellularis HH01]|uniref:Undecaprenyl-phosphate galactosephosphotransferase n=1 Tax=Richelia intracellularis HH01 TaxID=1165094 RepID=M1WZE6_9NOST|nr:sugar transferase [Richelia intracellularis]CCH67527.1 Undecaprenyl-phosphate galactosephosphotransferase [Richelia intracellularis HH01]HAE06022.1 STAS domain-containing protein [Richelia sp.]